MVSTLIPGIFLSTSPIVLSRSDENWLTKYVTVSPCPRILGAFMTTSLITIDCGYNFTKILSWISVILISTGLYPIKEKVNILSALLSPFILKWPCSSE